MKTLTVKKISWTECPGFSPPCTATVARKEIKKLQNEHGQVSARDLWESQTDDSAPMHNHFEWDDGVAAGKHRDAQARILMSFLRVEYKEDPEPQQLMVRTRVSGSTGYEELHTALVDESKELLSLTDAKSLISRTARRIKHIEAAQELVRQMQMFAASK